MLEKFENVLFGQDKEDCQDMGNAHKSHKSCYHYSAIF